MTIFWIWIAINLTFIAWRSVVAAGRPDVVPAKLAGAKR